MLKALIYPFSRYSHSKVFSKLPRPGLRSLASTSFTDVLQNHDEAQVKLMNEMCIVIDEKDQVLGARSKKDCHLMENIRKGLLHRGFSVLLFNSKGEFLLTQRSDVKITFPGCYTNACCSHPLYTPLEMDETDAIGVRRAAQRRLESELGIAPHQVPLDEIQYMTRMIYRVPCTDTWGEAEIVHILVVNKDVTLEPCPNEVKSHIYLSKEDLKPFLANVKERGGKLTPWLNVYVEQFMSHWWDNLNNLDKLKAPHVIYPALELQHAHGTNFKKHSKF